MLLGTDYDSDDDSSSNGDSMCDSGHHDCDDDSSSNNDSMSNHDARRNDGHDDAHAHLLGFHLPFVDDTPSTTRAPRMRPWQLLRRHLLLGAEYNATLWNSHPSHSATQPLWNSRPSAGQEILCQSAVQLAGISAVKERC